MSIITDDQLSLVLGEHAAGFLRRNGQDLWGRNHWGDEVCYKQGSPQGCIVQVILNDPDASGIAERFPEISDAFDSAYLENWTPEHLLQWIQDAPWGETTV